jgi:biotin operon repressor
MTWVTDSWTQQQIVDELHIERETAKKRIQRLRRRAQTLVA